MKDKNLVMWQKPEQEGAELYNWYAWLVDSMAEQEKRYDYNDNGVQILSVLSNFAIYTIVRLTLKAKSRNISGFSVPKEVYEKYHNEKI